MTLGEKSAALTGPDNLRPNKVGQSNGVGISNIDGLEQEGEDSFIDVLDSACDKLMDRQIKYSIRRIREMDERLCVMERELDEFLLTKNRK